MRTFRHWTPRYVISRLQLAWYELRNPESPWLTRPMVEILDNWIRPGDWGIEWGSGRSTLWFAKRAGRLLSIEHDEVWHRRVKQQLEVAKLDNVDYRFVAPSDYTKVVEGVPEESVDFILVDGIERDRCALTAIPRLRPTGILIIDNSNWYLPSSSRSPNSRRLVDRPASDAWNAFLTEVRDWRYIWTTNGVTDSALWIKPCTRPARA